MVFDNFPDIDLDPTAPRASRLMKLAIGALVAAFVALTVFWISRVDVFPDAVKVTNDTGGAVVCYQRVKSNGHDYVQDAGRLDAGERGNIQARASCSVFDTGGRYLACLRIPNDGKPSALAASSADRSISAEVCVYPR